MATLPSSFPFSWKDKLTSLYCLVSLPKKFKFCLFHLNSIPLKYWKFIFRNASESSLLRQYIAMTSKSFGFLNKLNLCSYLFIHTFIHLFFHNFFIDLPGGPVVKNTPANVGDMGSVSALGDSTGHGAMKPVHQNPPEPVSIALVACNKRGLRSENPAHWNRVRVGKTRGLGKKIGDTKGIFCAKMSTTKDRKGKDLTEAD